MKKIFGKMSGWLTKDDIQRLEEASARPFRQRTYHERWRCQMCSHVFFYSTSKCPVCMGVLEKVAK